MSKRVLAPFPLIEVKKPSDLLRELERRDVLAPFPLIEVKKWDMKAHILAGKKERFSTFSSDRGQKGIHCFCPRVVRLCFSTFSSDRGQKELSGPNIVCAVTQSFSTFSSDRGQKESSSHSPDTTRDSEAKSTHL